MNSIINNIINQIETNFICLHLGIFFSNYAVENNLCNKAKNIKLIFPDQKGFILSGYKIKDSLENLYINQEKDNFFSTFIEVNAFRGILSAMLEGIEKEKKFKIWIKNILNQNKMESFRYSLRFIRNIFSHNIDPNMKLHTNDFKELKKKIFSLNTKLEKKGVINLNIKYEDILPKTNIKNYGFQIKIDFSSLKEGISLYQIVPKSTIYMLCEFCYNLVLYYKLTD